MDVRSRPLTSNGALAKPFSRNRSVLRLGYVGLVDAAPLLVAAERGLFERYGLNVALTREVGWATIREKVMFGELDAAHALCTLPFAATLGLSMLPVPCVSALTMSRGGNAVVLSEEIRQRGVKNQETLRLDVENRKAFRKYKFATVYACSTHNFQLRAWLEAAEIDPDEDVELVTLPPTQMCRNLAAGTIDGFCAGEPWPSLAISQKIGWSPVCSVDLFPDHAEKVLMVRKSFVEEHEEEHLALVAALADACELCDDPERRREVAVLLSDRKRVNCEPELIDECLSPVFNYGLGRVETKPNFFRFHSDGSTVPRAEDAAWLLQRIAEGFAIKVEEDFETIGRRVFRADLHEMAIKRREPLTA